MPRRARLVVPGYPHHVTQRGNRRLPTFFEDADYRNYLRMLAELMPRAGVEIWAYCLMPNHVHIVAVPARPNSLARLFRQLHHRHAKRINKAQGWRGHLWQERFYSSVMDERHLVAAVRYIELNPVRAGLCRRVRDWPWSSVHAHLRGRDDEVVCVQPMLQRISDWAGYLASPEEPGAIETLRASASTGRPAAGKEFIVELERKTGQRIARGKPGPRPANQGHCPRIRPRSAN